MKLLQGLRRKPTVRGHIDRVQEGTAFGWAFDSAAPTTRLPIEILMGDAVIATGTAATYRDDLEAAGMGDGTYSFCIPLPLALIRGAPRDITARVAGTGHVLSGQFTINGDLRGQIEHLSEFRLIGWVSYERDSGFFVDVWSEGVLVGYCEIRRSTARGTRVPFQIDLPAFVADGRVRSFRLTERMSGLTIAEGVFAMPISSMPEPILQQYAKDFPAFAATNASARYRALERQLALASRWIGDEAALAAHIDQVQRAHAQVKAGPMEREGDPPHLRFSRPSAPDASIVIAAHDKFWVTYTCLAALILAPNEATFEVILVDDGSTDRTSQIESFVEGVRVIRNAACEGFVRSVNKGVAEARGGYVVVLQNDTEPCIGWLDALLAVFRRFDKVGLVGGKLVDPNGRLQDAGGLLSEDADALAVGRGANAYDPAYQYVRQVDFVSSGCFAVDPALWRQLGGFDEVFSPAYFEDADLALRVKAAGFGVYYTPVCQVVHWEGTSAGTADGRGVGWYRADNAARFKERWSATCRSLAPADPALACDRGIAARALVIDAHVPMADEDARGRQMAQHMQLLRSLGIKVTFVPADLAYRAQYVEALQAIGIECCHAPFALDVNGLIRARGKEFALFYAPSPAVLEAFGPSVRKHAPGAKIVFEDTDARALAQVGREAAGIAAPTAVDLILSRAATSTPSSNPIPTAPSPWVLDEPWLAPPFATRSGLALWIDTACKANADPILAFAVEGMAELTRRDPDLKLRVFGDDAMPKLHDLAAKGVETAFDANPARVVAGCRLLVVPHAFTADLVASVEMALRAGTPLVMRSAAARDLGLAECAGVIVEDDLASWPATIADICNDAARWTELSAQVVSFANERCSFAAGRRDMRAALEKIGLFVG